MFAYIRKVAWESVTHIIKGHTTPEVKDCPHWPEEFWQDATLHGFGGTCFESSLAFYSLVTALRYEGYLTVNDMGTSYACHVATIMLLGRKKYLVANSCYFKNSGINVNCFTFPIMP